MDVEGRNHITVKDILIGDVWFCSGQSNMVHQLRLHSVFYPNAIPDAHYPDIRQFWIPTLTDLNGPERDLPTGYWKPAVPADVGEFSAVAYFFARDLYDRYHVPIGIINASVGGTPIEAWISKEGFNGFDRELKTIARNQDTAFINKFQIRRLKSSRGKPKDKGLTGQFPWYSPDYVPKEWRQIGIPGYFEDQGLRNLNGIVWYRREITLPASMDGKEAMVYLGRIVDADELYINGKKVGQTTYQYPQRRYKIPTGLLKAGANLFVIRVTNHSGKGGFVPDKPYYIFADADTVDLKGYWTYKVGQIDLPASRRGGGFGFSAQNAPTALYNAMVAPETKYAIKGFVWYQGESNTGNAAEYAKLLPALIKDWRTKWNESDLPFLFVQLPGFGDYNYLPAESNTALLRESQRKTLSVPRTAMAVAIELGEWNDIHPDRKKPIGDRLARAAERMVYGENIVAAGPLFRSAVKKGGKVVLSFSNVGGGLQTSDGEPLEEFAIAGSDKHFVWATAKIQGKQVVVYSDQVSDPSYIRYAWADNPVNPNLENKEGLPASPFETQVQ
jgi:sialate O-acetylesterase